MLKQSKCFFWSDLEQRQTMNKRHRQFQLESVRYRHITKLTIEKPNTFNIINGFCDDSFKLTLPRSIPLTLDYQNNDNKYINDKHKLIGSYCTKSKMKSDSTKTESKQLKVKVSMIKTKATKKRKKEKKKRKRRKKKRSKSKVYTEKLNINWSPKKRNCSPKKIVPTSWSPQRDCNWSFESTDSCEDK